MLKSVITLMNYFFKLNFLIRWIIIYSIFKLLGFILIETDLTYVAGILLINIIGNTKILIMRVQLPNVYLGIISLRFVNIILLHFLLYVSIIGYRKVIKYLFFIFFLCLFNFILKTKLGYLASEPGLNNLFFHIWGLAILLIVKTGIIPFMLLIYQNEKAVPKF